jgi:hypothetical protein
MFPPSPAATLELAAAPGYGCVSATMERFVLHFSDQAELIRVSRVNIDPDGATRRERLGVIQKDTLALPAGLRDAVSPEEAEEIDGVVRLYREVGAREAQYLAARLPEILRLVLERYQEGADAAERRLIADAVLAAARVVRRSEREPAEG